MYCCVCTESVAVSTREYNLGRVYAYMLTLPISIPMKPAKKIKLTDLTETTAAQPGSSVASTVNTSSMRPAQPARQTHGMSIPTGPIQSVGELIAGRGTARGSVASFDTLGEYTKYLHNLSLGELHRHALEEAKIVPIDDRGRLIRRLEGEWGAFAARLPANRRPQAPQPVVMTEQQLMTNRELMKKALRT